MTDQTQRPYIFKIASTAAFHHWQDVIGVPQALAGDAAQSPLCQCPAASRAALTFEVKPLGHGIHAALCAYTTVAFKCAFPQIRHVRAQPPLLHAPFRAECLTSSGHLQIAPAAQIAPVLALWQFLAARPSTLHRSLCSTFVHGCSLIYRALLLYLVFMQTHAQHHHHHHPHRAVL